MLMKKIQLFYFINFSDLDQLYTSPYLDTLKNLSKRFGKINIVDMQYLTFPRKYNAIKKKKNEKYFKFYSPKNIFSLNSVFKNKRAIILSSIVRNLANLPLLIYLNIMNITLIELSNLGNIQKGTDYYLGKKNLLTFKKVFNKNLIKKFLTILSICKIISKVDCKFTSNQKIYLEFKNRRPYKKFFSYYRNVKLVKSNIYEKNAKKIKDERYITLIDVYPFYEQYTDYKIVKLKDVKKHYYYLNNLLTYLEKILKKKVVVCIHPKYPYEFYQKYLPGRKVVKYQTSKYVLKSFIVLSTNSSAIVQAIKFDKKIISVQSFLFKGEKYSSSVYQELLRSEKITLKNSYQINKKNFVKNLEKKVINYKKFKELYFGTQLKNKSSIDITNYINHNYNNLK
tara:strand:- start:8204 stop:9391 length:1188 start_codon:yes stop_codon:yes gene_type:complete